jgi:CubicO group peptidase (beta-lactamase class C family)
MNVGSIAKPFTGVAMMRAVQEGKLSLDEDINQYLPFRVVNSHFPNERITLRHLATHTSGITDDEEVYAGTYHYGGDSPDSLGDFLQRYFVPADRPRRQRPGRADRDAVGPRQGGRRDPDRQHLAPRRAATRLRRHFRRVVATRRSFAGQPALGRTSILPAR